MVIVKGGRGGRRLVVCIGFGRGWVAMGLVVRGVDVVGVDLVELF